MKQYCRYCCNACLNDDELAYCSYKDKMLEALAVAEPLQGLPVLRN